ncbi:MAG: TraB/GumN family protein [Ruminococcus sp.]|nr:TraB/GumN family protein [Ruminococcus sp.]
MKLKNKVLAALLGVSMLLCSCSESSSQTNISSSSKAQTEQTTTTTQQTSEQTTTTSATEQTSQTETSSQSPEQKTPQGVPMWEGTAPNGNKITFLGSMHAAKSDFYPLPDKIMSAYNAADVVAFECDTEATESEQGMLEIYQQMTYSDNTQLKDKLSPEAYAIFSKHMTELGSSAEIYQSFKPWAAYEMINSLWIIDSEISVSNGIDYYLLHKTKTDNKTLVELESAQIQIDMLSGQSDKTYDALIKATVNDTKQTAQNDLKQLYELWLKGDLDAISNMEAGTSDEDLKKLGLTDEDISLLAAYGKATNADRNPGMAAKIKELFASGKKTMVCVGTAHYLGETGIIALLEKEGYTFKRI